MRASITLLLAITSALLTACGGGSGGAQNVLPPIAVPVAAASAETPLSASAFVDSVGVNLHMTYVVGAYNTGFAAWSPILASSGIKHARDGICPTFVDVNWCAGVASARMNELASSGIKFDLVTSMNDPFSYVAAYANTMSLGSAIEAYEGPNECDASKDCPSTWQSTEAGWQQQLYALESPAVTIAAPSMTSSAGYAALGNLSAYAQIANIHDYPAVNQPEIFAATPEHLQWAGAMTGNEPAWSTEDGYNTDPTYANNGVPQAVQARYLPRLLLEHLRLGVMRTYIYQLFDFGSDGGGSNMGLLNADYTPKPAWTALLQLMRLFADSGASPRAALRFSISGDTSATLDHVLFQRSDGTYLLALWLAQPVYDPTSRAMLPLASEHVTLTLPAGTSSATLTPFADSGAEAPIALAGPGGVFQVPVRSTVSVLEFRV